jgi:hypothetical protein
MSNGFIYVVDAHFIAKIEEEKILDPSACGDLAILLYFATSAFQSYLARCCFDNNNFTDDLL